ncbi:MAG: helix-hairpin-helix domain-containing protein [Roseburia sp.]|nr:helix-hairpin-helix domain-containing protein [Roseburia sp.]
MMYTRKGFLTAAFLLCLMAGCGTEHTVYLEQTTAATEQMEDGGDTAEAEEQAQDAAGGEAPEDAAGGKNAVRTAAEQAAAAGAKNDLNGTEADDAGEERQECCVYVCGAVRSPGVYILDAGARIYEAIALAGGLAENAGLTAVNQAQEICDGQMIYIPTKEEAAAYPAASQTAAGSASEQTAQAAGEQEADGRVNLNTASEAELMTLSGIGQSKAEAILLYRETHGGFSSVEEIMNVDGIKEGSYNRIKDSIKVK